MLLSNRYQVLQTLGSGGFGTTFLAEDTQMPSRRKCVIKQLKPIENNPVIYKLVQERFQREAAILEDLGDVNGQIPRLYAYFTEASHFYLIQEWVDGLTLSAKIQTEGIMGEAAVRQLLVGILPVLEHLHGKQIIHRDIKPDNIMLRKRDNQPVLIDFGAVREAMGTVVNSQGQATSSIVIGTPGFMPSEQAAGRPMYSSDLYSLGLTMIYLLTAKQPQELDLDPRTGDVIWQRHAPNISDGFLEILTKAIQYNPRDRYATAQEMLAALQPQQGSAPIHDSISIPEPPDLSAGDRAISSSVSDTTVPATIITAGQPPATLNRPMAASVPTDIASMIGKDKPVPAEIPGWNWGAFFLPGFWSFNNQVWLGLFSWSGIFTWFLGWFVVGGILGAKGNEWAWKNRSWRSVEEFKANQRSWAIAGSLVWGGTVALFSALILVLLLMPTSSNPPETTNNPSSDLEPEASSTATDQSMTNVFGEPIQLTSPNRNIDGTWTLNYANQSTTYTSVLTMQGDRGNLVTEFSDPSGTVMQIQQNMQLWDSSQGLVVLGYSPTNLATQSPASNYVADNFLFQPLSDGSMKVRRCNDNQECTSVMVVSP